MSGIGGGNPLPEDGPGHIEIPSITVHSITVTHSTKVTFGCLAPIVVYLSSMHGDGTIG